MTKTAKKQLKKNNTKKMKGGGWGDYIKSMTGIFSFGKKKSSETVEQPGEQEQQTGEQVQQPGEQVQQPQESVGSAQGQPQESVGSAPAPAASTLNGGRRRKTKKATRKAKNGGRIAKKGARKANKSRRTRK